MIIDTEFQTPHFICEYMAGLVPQKAVTILEPTPGLGNLVTAIERLNRHQVIAAEDFFLIEKTQKFDCVVMNPPFSSKSAYMKNAPAEIELSGMKVGYYILKTCMEMSDHIIALMPWFTLSDSDVRLRHLKSFGIKSLTPLPRKTFQYARIQTVVIELEKGYTGNTFFHTIHF